MTQPPAPTHACPGHCGREVDINVFACRTCWFRLPREYRANIVDSYRSIRHGRQGGRMAHARAMSDAMEWYRECRRVMS